ncbi:MAG: hypothetical protein KBG07_00195 [Elusimicrobia bacterium]|nr:hypothetical protein [Elusimicrobiota bacterium]
MPNLHLLVKALMAEEALDFKQVEKERLKLVERLALRLAKDKLDLLVQKSFQYRAGQIGYGDYHRFLKSLCRENGISLGDLNQLDNYIEYVLLADKIDRNNLLNELTRAEKASQDRLAITSEQKKLVAVARRLALLEKLSTHTMTPDDWAAFEKEREHILTIASDLATLSGEEQALPLDTLAGLLSPSESFCRFAIDRNAAFIDNLSAQMEMKKASSAVLVAGGFHSDGLTRLLRERDLSYVVVSPKISEVPKENNYLDVFARDPLPLEKLFAGEKISLNSARLSGGTMRGFEGPASAFRREGVATMAATASLEPNVDHTALSRTAESTAAELSAPMSIEISGSSNRTWTTIDTNGDDQVDLKMIATPSGRSLPPQEDSPPLSTVEIDGRAKITFHQIRPGLFKKVWASIRKIFPIRSPVNSRGGVEQTPILNTGFPILQVPQGGLIGKFRLLSDPQWDPASKTVSFVGQDIENPGKPPETIRLEAEIVDREEWADRLYSSLSGPGNDLVIEIMDWFQEAFHGPLIVLKDNPITQGIGTQVGEQGGFVAVSERYANNHIAWFHEIAEAMAPNADEILSRLSQNSQAWYKAHMSKPGRQGMERHYAIRALQREVFRQSDLSLTYEIKGRLSATDISKKLSSAKLKNGFVVRKEFSRQRSSQNSREGEISLLEDLINTQRKAEEEEIVRQRIEQEEIERRHAEETAVRVKIRSLLDLAKGIFEAPLASDLAHEHRLIEKDKAALAAVSVLRPLFEMNPEWVAEALVEDLMAGGATPADLYSLMGKDSFGVYLAKNVVPHLGERALSQTLLKLMEKRSTLQWNRRAFKAHAAVVTLFVDHAPRLGESATAEVAGPLLMALRKEFRARPYTRLSFVQGIPDYRRYFDVDGDVVFFKDDFLKRLLVRDMGARRNLHTLYHEAIREQEYLSSLTDNLLSKDTEGHLFNALLSTLHQEENPLVRAHLESSLIRAWRTTLPSAHERLLNLVKEIQATHHNGDERLKEDAIGRLLMIAHKDGWDSGISFDIVFSMAMDGLPGLFEAVRSQSSEIDKTPRGIERDMANRQMGETMTAVKKRLAILWRVALSATSQSSVPASISVAGRAMAYLVEVAQKEGDIAIRSETIALLGIAVEKGYPAAVRAFLPSIQPSSRQFENLFYNNPSDEVILNALRSKAMPVRLGFLLLRRYKNDPSRAGLLKAIVLDRKTNEGDSLGINAQIRFYAFALYGSQYLKTTNEDRITSSYDENQFQEMAGALAPHAHGFIGTAIDDSKLIDRLFDGWPGQDEELGAYAIAAVLDAFHGNLTGLKAKGFVAVAERAVNARASSYLNNANDDLLFGGHLLRRAQNPVQFFFQAMVHELTHILLENQHDYLTGELVGGTIHEWLADLAAEDFSRRRGLSLEDYRDILGFDRDLSFVEEDSFHTIEVHEGARAQQLLIAGWLSENGLTLDPSKMVRAALDVLPGTSGDDLDVVVRKVLERFAGRPLEDSETAGMNRMFLSLFDYRFDEFIEGKYRQRILSLPVLREILSPLLDGLATSLQSVFPSGQEEGVLAEATARSLAGAGLWTGGLFPLLSLGTKNVLDAVAKSLAARGLEPIKDMSPRLWPRMIQKAMAGGLQLELIQSIVGALARDGFMEERAWTAKENAALEKVQRRLASDLPGVRAIEYVRLGFGKKAVDPSTGAEVSLDTSLFMGFDMKPDGTLRVFVHPDVFNGAADPAAFLLDAMMHEILEGPGGVEHSILEDEGIGMDRNIDWQTAEARISSVQLRLATNLLERWSRDGDPDALIKLAMVGAHGVNWDGARPATPVGAMGPTFALAGDRGQRALAHLMAVAEDVGMDSTLVERLLHRGLLVAGWRAVLAEAPGAFHYVDVSPLDEAPGSENRLACETLLSALEVVVAADPNPTKRAQQIFIGCDNQGQKTFVESRFPTLKGSRFKTNRFEGKDIAVGWAATEVDEAGSSSLHVHTVRELNTDGTPPGIDVVPSPYNLSTIMQKALDSIIRVLIAA